MKAVARMSAGYRKPWGRFVMEIQGGTAEEQAQLISASVQCIANAAAHSGPRATRIAAEQFYRFADDLSVSGGALSVDNDLVIPPTLAALQAEAQRPAPPKPPWWKGFSGGWYLGIALGVAFNVIGAALLGAWS